MAITNVNRLTNNEMFIAARAASKNFENLTAEMTYESFKDAVLGGVDAQTAVNLVNELTRTAIQWFLNEVHGQGARDTFEAQGLGEKYFSDFAGAMQNMYVTVGNPIDPKFKNIADKASVDPFTFRKPVVEDIFYTFNYDYQNTHAIQEVEMKSAFASQYGLSGLVAGIMKGFESKFIQQVRSFKEEALNAAINDEREGHTLKDTQQVEIVMADAPSTDELIEFISTVNNTVDAMTIQETGAFNRMNWCDLQDKGRLKLITRPNLKNSIKTKVLQAAFNKEELNMDIDIVTLPSFGGLTPKYKQGDELKPAYKVYDSLGAHIGFAKTEGASTANLTDADIIWDDPNEDIIAIIADKGCIFELDQNAYRVDAIYNPAGLYTTYWASKVNGSVHYDPYKNFVVIKKVSE